MKRFVLLTLAFAFLIVAVAPWVWLFAVWPVMFSILGGPQEPLRDGAEMAVFLWPFWSIVWGFVGMSLMSGAD